MLNIYHGTGCAGPIDSLRTEKSLNRDRLDQIWIARTLFYHLIKFCFINGK